MEITDVSKIDDDNAMSKLPLLDLSLTNKRPTLAIPHTYFTMPVAPLGALGSLVWNDDAIVYNNLLALGA